MKELQEYPHKRFNPLTGEWVLVSPHRTKRPWQGKKEETVRAAGVSYQPDCYLCPGNERAGGMKNPDYDGVFAFTNDFAALTPDDHHLPDTSNPLFRAEAERGICRVVCFSPDHSATLPQMEVAQIEKVIGLWREEYEALGKKDFINYVQIFENKGEIMGCSNPHPHGQIWATRGIPDIPAKEQQQQQQYFNQHGRTLLTDYVQQELQKKERIVIESEHFVALVPFWAVWPYETMIVSRHSIQNITKFSQAEVLDFATMIKQLTVRYDNLFETSFPYSAGIHQAPTDGKEHPEWHFHMHFYPPLLRSATVKKFMVGYEMLGNPQRDITAEYSAKVLKELSDQHYLNN